jgi:hypothetical protein
MSTTFEEAPLNVAKSTRGFSIATNIIVIKGEFG